MEEMQIEYRKLATPKAASIAGILFALLFASSLILLRLAIPEDLTADPNWVESGRKKITAALLISPFAAVAFLWFVGVVRDRLGEYEDKFFSTIFFGSSMLFLAMVFVSMGIIGGLMAVARISDGVFLDENMVYFARSIVYQLSNIYGLRMAGVFMISLGSTWMGTGIYPRWLVIFTFLIATALLLIIDYSLWVTLLFPGWVFFISVYKIITRKRAAK
jgi:hypothetical protein